VKARSVLRIARWELVRSVGETDRRTAVVAVVALLLGTALAPAFAAGAGAPTTDIYRVGVAPDSPYHAPVAAEPSLRAVEPSPGALAADGADVLITDSAVRATDTPKGQAALTTLRDAVAAYNDRALDGESDRAAAFPVEVSLRYVDQTVPLVVDTDDAPSDPQTATEARGADGTTASQDETADTSDDGTRQPATAEPATVETGESAAPSLLGGGQQGTPGEIAPPFPFRSLVLAFLFVIPLNLVVQGYGSSVMSERLNRRGEPLLVAPVTPGAIVAGKTVPYAVAGVASTVAIAAAIGVGPVAVAAVLPVVALFLATGLLAALFARSFKELTFVTMTASVAITSYVFVPAIFTSVHPVASISPLSVVVSDLTGEPTGAGTVLFATLPMTLVAVSLFGLGVGVYREEDLFTQRPPQAKAVDALAAHLTPRRVPVWGALAVPFVFVAELFALAVLFPVRPPVVALLAVVALIEEVAKSASLRAGFLRGRLPVGRRAALVFGALAGVGFAVGEKLTLVAQLVGLPSLELGRATFPEASAGGLAVLLVAPFALHATTTAVAALGARRSRRAYALAVVAAAALHLAYNWGVFAIA
jgi:ABC-type Na+ efflux pump permease subunit